VLHAGAGHHDGAASDVALAKSSGSTAAVCSITGLRAAVNNQARGPQVLIEPSLVTTTDDSSTRWVTLRSLFIAKELLQCHLQSGRVLRTDGYFG